MQSRYAVTVFSVWAVTLGACSSPTDDGQANTAGSASIAGASGGTVTTSGGSSNSAGVGGSLSAGMSAAGGSMSSAGAAGAAAAGVSGAGGDSNAMLPVKPQMRDGKWAFDLGEVTLEVDPQVGARITTFSLGAENLLTGPVVNPTYWGSTLWTSPESQWTQPPPAPIDSAAYAAVANDTELVLTGQPYPMLGVSVTKRFSVDTKLRTFVIQYQLTNTKSTPIQMAPWEVTRVLPRGLTFFPTGPSMSLSAGATLPTTDSGGITWYTYDMNAVTKDSKLYADSAEGWVAHVAQGLVFIKSFGDLTANQIAPKEGDLELYTNALHTYVEIEDQGAYGSIAPGASVTWKVAWFLRKLPAGVDAVAGNSALATFVRDTIAGK